MTLISSIYILDGCPLFAYLCINLFVEIAMTKDGIIQDVNAKTRVLMKNDFNRQQAEALFGFVHEQIKEYCHTKVDQKIFEKKLFERLDQLATKDELKQLEIKMFGTFATKDDLKQFATKDDLKHFATKEDLTQFATKDDLKHFATKEDLKHFATKEDLKQFATKEDLTQFATKEDLTQFATKEDLKQFATKEDLTQFATKEDLKQFAMKEDLKQFATKEDLTQFATKEDLKILQNQINELALAIKELTQAIKK
jgi:uncharacterized protein YneR